MQTFILLPITADSNLAFAQNALLDFFSQNKINATSFTLNTAKIKTELADDKMEQVLESITGSYYDFAHKKNSQIVITSGYQMEDKNFIFTNLNCKLAISLNAKIILVGRQQPDLLMQIKFAENYLYKHAQQNIFGVIITDCNAAHAPCDIQRLIAALPQQSNYTKTDAEKYFAHENIMSLIKISEATKITPPYFRALLKQKSIAANKTIVLPEGDEIRTIKAAIITTNEKIATCILLGNKTAITKIAQENNIELPATLKIVEPDIIRKKYIDPLYNKRKDKGMTKEEAEKKLQDNVFIGTMMVECGDADGLVSGAVHTTANTILPALQIIKTKPECNLVSSIFFMCLEDQVLVFGDCAINPKPTAAELADIAIQSTDSAKAFGIEPKVAMISYSTGTSGKGVEVDKVVEAINLVKNKRPDIIIDGPLQYDAAIVPDVAKTKAPNSLVAGAATVLIFPDLNTGNTVYKAVQRTANIITIGPMLQGLNKPVNDLSRGCLVEDIVFTIALTAIQAQQ